MGLKLMCSFLVRAWGCCAAGERGTEVPISNVPMTLTSFGCLILKFRAEHGAGGMCIECRLGLAPCRAGGPGTGQGALPGFEGLCLGLRHTGHSGERCGTAGCGTAGCGSRGSL